MIVRQSASVDACSGQAANVLGVHAIMNSFVRPRRFSRCNGGLEVYDAKIDPLCARRAATCFKWLGRPASSCRFAAPAVFVRLKALPARGGFGDFGPFKLLQCIAPDVIEIQRP